MSKTPKSRKTPTPTHSTPPLAEFAIPPGETYPALSNWDDIDEWGCKNAPQWREIWKQAARADMPQSEVVKCLAAEMLRLYVDLQKVHVDYVMGRGGESAA